MNTTAGFNPNGVYVCEPMVRCFGFTELMFYTSVQPNLEKVRSLATPNNINDKNKEGWTALMLAARNSKVVGIEIVKLLLDRGADVNLQNNEKYTALMMAAMNSNTDSNIETVKLLLDKGADVNLVEFLGWTALMMAARSSNKESNIETVKLLLEYGADVNIQDNEGWTALMWASQNSNEESNIETVKLLLDYGSEPYEALKHCPTEECKKVLSERIWQRMQTNIKTSARQYSEGTPLFI